MSQLDPGSFVRDLVDELDREVGSGVKGVQDWIEGQVHAVAVGLLDTILPAMVRANTTAVRAREWAEVAGAGGSVVFTLGTADIGNTVLSGAVAEKVSEGIEHIRTNADYLRGVNSITW